MSERALRGVPASPGHVTGPVWHMPTPEIDGTHIVVPHAREAELARARQGLAAAADELRAVAAGLSAAEADIVQTSVLMAADPMLLEDVQTRILQDGMPAARALLSATETHAELLAAIDDAHLAARADDVRALGRQAAAAAMAGDEPPEPVPDGAIVVAHDLGPGDVPQVAGRAAGIALAAGGATAHAAIVARSLGVPMVCGLGDEVLELSAGAVVLLDGAQGAMTVDPVEVSVARVGARMRARKAADARDRAERDLASVTRDGRAVAVLANAVSVGEIRIALDYGAAGVGLVRTELAFLEARRWPTAAEHRAAVAPLLEALGRRPAVVRVLDLGADKSPPFVAAGSERGLALLLAQRGGFEQQLEGLLPLAAGRDLRLMLPLVRDGAQLREALGVIDHAVERLGCRPVPIGSMVETPSAADGAAELAAASAFLSIGTNDLTAATLGEDRFGGSIGPSHHPAVLRHIAQTVAAARAAGITVEVCGEAASTPLMAPLLIGLGVDELSVGAARVGTVRRWIRGMHHDELADVAGRALTLSTPEDVAALMAGVRLDGVVE